MITTVPIGGDAASSRTQTWLSNVLLAAKQSPKRPRGPGNDPNLAQEPGCTR